jgi:hypothetical protein
MKILGKLKLIEFLLLPQERREMDHIRRALQETEEKLFINHPATKWQQASTGSDRSHEIFSSYSHT